MRRLFLAAVAALGLLAASPALAQFGGTPVYGTTNCGTPTLNVVNGAPAQLWVGLDGKLCSAAALTPSSSASAGLSPVSSAALAANTVIKNTAPTNLYSFEVSADSTLSAAPWWIMIYDATSAPADGAITPLKCYAMASGATSFSAAWMTPIAAATGIVIGVSTTGCFTKTASSHAFISGDAK
jgi:hypothetical protein